MDNPHKGQVQTLDKPATAVVLCSGGIDSTVLLHQLHHENRVAAGLSFTYGARHGSREIPFAKFHCRNLGISHHTIDLSFIGQLFSSSLLDSGNPVPDGRYDPQNMRQTVVPFRNGIMLSAAAGFAESIGAAAVAIGAHTGEHSIYPDCTEEFMIAMNDAIRLGTYAKIQILRPLIDKTKAEIVRLGATLGVDFKQTWSCYKGDDSHCGKCGTCIERREAFQTANIPDPAS